MQWWNDFVTWFNSAAGQRVFTTAILPFIAILVAGILAAVIARSSARRVIDHQDREIKAAAIMALIGAGRRAAIWSSLGSDEKQHVDSLISEADLRMRLLPVSGAIAAADWANHELEAMKKNSSNFSFQAEQTFFDYRDRLLDWQLKPSKAKKLFAFDLVQWQYEDKDATALTTSQPEWTSSRVEPASTPVVPRATPVTPAPAATTPISFAPSATSTPVVEPEPVEPPEDSTPVTTTDSPATAAALAVAPPPTVPPLTGGATFATPSVPRDVSSVSEDTDEDAATDSEAQDESGDPIAPPVGAGAVRQRIAPEQSLGNN
jgi:hypothetical protein